LAGSVRQPLVFEGCGQSPDHQIMQLGLRHVMDDEPVGNLDVAEGIGRGREVGIGRQPPRLIRVQDGMPS
jgi:hypothetical protein